MNSKGAASSGTANAAAPIPLTTKPPAAGPGGSYDGAGTAPARTACIRTFGCQMNVHDSDRMRRMVRDAGYDEVSRYEDADLVVLNTCYVRENAVQKVKGHLGELSRLKKEGRVKKVALTGCIGAAREATELERKFGIDLVLGTHNTYELAEFVGLPGMEETFTPELRGTEGGHSAFVTIMTGCNYVCSYCVVPQVRGRMVHRASESVVGEVRRLVSSGTGYVTLLGQTVDAWREPRGGAAGGGGRFCDLLRRVSAEAPRVWFTTSHPSNMEDRTLRLIGEEGTIVKKLHLPVQSGSDRMLKIMHRGYKAERYRRKIGVFREAVPDGTLSTDIIVGHPGETEEDHEATLRLVEECRFDSAYVFKFSPRGGTEAAELPGRVPEDVAQRRFLEVLRAVEQGAFEGNRRKIGLFEEIYVRHGRGHGEGKDAVGETWSGHAVHVPTDAPAGSYVTAKIEGAGPHVLYAGAPLAAS